MSSTERITSYNTKHKVLITLAGNLITAMRSLKLHNTMTYVNTD